MKLTSKTPAKGTTTKTSAPKASKPVKAATKPTKSGGKGK
jgi:hypothetical protein